MTTIFPHSLEIHLAYHLHESGHKTAIFFHKPFNDFILE